MIVITYHIAMMKMAIFVVVLVLLHMKCWQIYCTICIWEKNCTILIWEKSCTCVMYQRHPLGPWHILKLKRGRPSSPSILPIEIDVKHTESTWKYSEIPRSQTAAWMYYIKVFYCVLLDQSWLLPSARAVVNWKKLHLYVCRVLSLIWHRLSYIVQEMIPNNLLRWGVFDPNPLHFTARQCSWKCAQSEIYWETFNLKLLQQCCAF